MKTHLYITILILQFLFIAGLYGQNYHTSSSRAIKAYAEARQQYDFLYYNKAEKLLREAISYDRKFYEAYMLLAELYSNQQRHEEAAKNYRQALKIDSLFYKPAFFNLATAEFKTGDYVRALGHFRIYLEFNTGSEKNKATAQKGIKDCEFAISAKKTPVPYNPVNVGDSINTADNEYWPSITADGKTMMFTREKIIPGSTAQGQEDFYISTLRNARWSRAINAGAPLNTPENEGAQGISSDGSYMYFTSCNKPDGLGRCDIYFSSFDGKIWSAARNIGAPVNSRYWESQPSVSSNGRMLFFASNRPDGVGGMDIWYSVMGNNKKWKFPKNLGPLINTAGDEMSPFIHFDGKTLYFSSNGQTGMGGYDIYRSRMNDDTSWSRPENLGYPINTYNDELGLIIDAEGQNAYFSTIRDARKGKDIFSFVLYEAARPDPVSYFRGRVYDRVTMKLLTSYYELIDLKTGMVVSSGTTDVAGSFLVCLPSGQNYGLNVNKKGYLFYSDNFMFEGLHTASKPYDKRILLNPVRIGETMQLSNVFYEVDSWALKKESISELDRLYRLLKENPDIIVEVAGFTDSTGTVSYNQTLSERRAQAVVKWLTEKGIEGARLKSQGYGSASPIGDNITFEGRKLNRRTEVRVIGKK